MGARYPRGYGVARVNDPIARLIERQGVMMLDGGLATALEARGFDLDDELWSARVLLENPDAIRQVHLDFLTAGADCVTSSTYQASLPGFRKRGLSENDGIALLRRSVDLALEARDTFWSGPENREGRTKPLVAAGIGPYGAFLADGSEYTGRYVIDGDALYAFHKSRWDILAESPADLLACETIPSAQEAGVLMRLLNETPGRWAWVSFSCRDGEHLCDGSSIAGVIAACDETPNLAAVGVNCTSPEFIPSLIAEARRATDKPVLVYPNSGRRYLPETRTWSEASPGIDVVEACVEWARLGAAGIGGCCGVSAEEIAGMRRSLVTRDE